MPQTLTSEWSTFDARLPSSETRPCTAYALRGPPPSANVEPATTPTATNTATAAARFISGNEPRRSGRLAHDELRRELDAQRVDALSLDQPDEQADAHPSHLGERLAHRRESGRHDHRGLRVVEPHHGKIVGHGEPAAARCVQRADRNVVVEPEDRGRRLLQREQLVGGERAAGDAPIRVDDEFRVEQDPRGCERGAKAEEALLGRIPAGRAGDRADTPMAELEQMLGRLLRAGRVHRRGAGDSVGRLLPRVYAYERKAAPPKHTEPCCASLRQYGD